MLWIIVLLGLVGTGKMDGNSTTPEPLRKSLHGPTAGTAPSTVAQALTISESSGASHFQKLLGKNGSYSNFYIALPFFSPLQRVRTNWQDMLTLSSSFR